MAGLVSSDGVVSPSTSHLQPQNKHPHTVQPQRKCGEAVEPTDDEQTSLNTASENGQRDIVRSLLDRGFDVNEMDSRSITALHLASSKGKLEVAELLIERGAYVNPRNQGGWTPLQFASGSGNLELTRLD
ncbi:ankyrin repeat protein [Lactarius psammicola]|nr:ankyrin repeat protein [Lactarius psammicola]